MQRHYFVLSIAFALASCDPVAAAQLTRKTSTESVDSLLLKLESRDSADRLEALSKFDRIYGGWSGVGMPSDWEKWRLNDLCRALCDPEEPVRGAAAQAFIKVSGRKGRLVEPAKYLIRALQLKFDDPILAAAMKTPENERLKTSVRVLSAAALTVIFARNEALIPVLEGEVKKSPYSLTGAAGQLEGVRHVQLRIKEEVRPVLIELRKSQDKRLAETADKALEVIGTGTGK
jgi:hypothetical protein